MIAPLGVDYAFVVPVFAWTARPNRGAGAGSKPTRAACLAASEVAP